MTPDTRLPPIVQVEQRGPAAGQHVFGALHLRPVVAGHLEEITRVEVGFEDGAGFVGPAAVVAVFPFPVGALADDLDGRAVEGCVGR